MAKILFEKTGLKVHETTITRHKRAMDFPCRRTKFVPLIREPNKAHRLRFAQQVLEERINFNDIIFTDESTFQTHGNARISTVRVIRDEDFKIVKTEHYYALKPKHPAKVINNL